MGIAPELGWFSGSTAKNAVNQDMALQNRIVTGGNDGEAVRIRLAAMAFHPAAGGGMRGVEGSKQAVQRW